MWLHGSVCFMFYIQNFGFINYEFDTIHWLRQLDQKLFTE